MHIAKHAPTIKHELEKPSYVLVGIGNPWPNELLAELRERFPSIVFNLAANATTVTITGPRLAAVAHVARSERLNEH